MIRRSLFILLTVFTGILMVFALANAWDDDLDPAAQALMQKEFQPTEQGLRGFYHLLGLRAGEFTEPERVGRALWAEAQPLTPKQQGDFYDQKLVNRHGIWPSITTVGRKRETSAREYWSQTKEWREQEPKFSTHVAQYIRLIQNGELTQPRTSQLMARTDTPLQDLLKGHRLLALHLGELAEEKRYAEMEKLVQTENNFYQSFFRREYLLGAMIAHVVIEENANILDLEKKANPRLEFSPETLKSFVTPMPQEMVTAALHNEFRFFARMTTELNDGELLQLYGSVPLLSSLKTQLLLRPNATINRYYKFVSQELEKPCPPTDECTWAQPWWKSELPIAWIRNPAGKFMANMTMMHISGRVRKMEQRHQILTETLARL